jgi:hypothetical protein
MFMCDQHLPLPAVSNVGNSATVHTRGGKWQTIWASQMNDPKRKLGVIELVHFEIIHMLKTNK